MGPAVILSAQPVASQPKHRSIVSGTTPAVKNPAAYKETASRSTSKDNGFQSLTSVRKNKQISGGKYIYGRFEGRPSN